MNIFSSIKNSRRWKYTLLFLLYFSQGLPFGFQATALPVYLRTEGVSLTAIGLVGMLAVPWMLKALWAPLVDRYGSHKFGRRKSWIAPMQALLFLTIFFASFISPVRNPILLLVAVFFMNLFAATQDIAVDGLAVDLLGPDELGHGNAAQVVGYKTGMLVSGGLLVWLSSYIGWDGFFLVMAGLVIVPLAAILIYPESSADLAFDPETQGLRNIIALVRKIFRLPGAFWFIVFIATYKLGESMIDVMFKPFLIDSGFTASQIGLWVGAYGMAASLAGSFAGGFLASGYSFRKALTVSAIFRLIPLVLVFWLTFVRPSDAHVIGITIAEHFFGGMLTTAVFAYMMSRIDRRIGATHYTIIAAIEVMGKSPGSWASGILADSVGYSGLFGLGVILSLLVLLILPRLEE